MKTHSFFALVLVACSTEMSVPAGAPDKPGSIEPSLQAPSRAVWDPTSFSPIGGEVVLTLSNPRPVNARFGDVRVLFSATREGVPMACRSEPVVPLHEAHVLGPNARVRFIRRIDCAMPFPGRYDIRVLASWSDAPPHEVGAFAIDVEASSDRKPRPIREGLVGALAGPQLVNPTSKWLATIAILNQSAVTQPLGSARIVLRSHPVDHDIWCEGPPTDVQLPATLVAGRMHVMRAPLACDLQTPGFYAVQAALELDGNGKRTTIGEMRVRVTNDAMELTPPLLPLP